MQKPLVFNRFLNKKWKSKENAVLTNKLTLVKSEVDIKCPESYITFKTKLKRENPMINRCNLMLIPSKSL